MLCSQNVFSAMVTDNNIAKSIAVGADKMRYVVKFGIAPVSKSVLIDSVKKVKVFEAWTNTKLWNGHI